MRKMNIGSLKMCALSAAILVGITGCNDDDDSTSSAPIDFTSPITTTQGTFVDAAVDGLYYTDQLVNSGFTDNGGQYSAISNTTLTFYLGGEDGLKVGAASNRDVLSPFEATGTYERAVNLAILLQSVNVGDQDLNIVLPETLSTNIGEATISALHKINLDDQDTVITFLEDHMGMNEADIVSEDDAVAHMNSSLKEYNDRGEDSSVPMFQRGSANIIREVSINQYQLHELNDHDPLTNQKQFYVHADKTIDEETFDLVRSSARWDYKLSGDAIVFLEGNNDSGFSSAWASQYLSCVASTGDSRKFTVTDDDQTKCDGQDATTDERFNLGSQFSYKFNNPNESEPEESMDYDDEEIESYMPYVLATSQSQLNSMIETELYDDSNNRDGTAWQYNIYSQSYDATTEVLTILDKKFNLGSEQDKSAPSVSNKGGVSEKIRFIYQIDDQETDRYVNFVGTWEHLETCENGVQARSEYVFGEKDITVSGKECTGSTPVELDDEGPYSYADFSNLDYWWFNQTGRTSKATLSELNTTVRFCDSNNYVMGTECPQGKEYFVKWSYMPAGKDWDQGVLTRRKMLPTGESKNVSTYQKIN
ncbi:hypothetical protein L1D37_08850 [Vibrio sp. Isolate33]|uniref:hypothetical protein n=1 Tax=Vibrio sp. Isolate33 TaxID=2908539 RepID=UPI001EFDBF22|nr:hypothetical protein [Vibrio sp. Isolate33]MCG9543876.1 hypothetical protein [Vibrio sp. Isolate33]